MSVLDKLYESLKKAREGRRLALRALKGS